MAYNQEDDYAAFKEQFSDLALSYKDNFVVFHKGQFDKSFKTRTEALSYARNKFGKGNYIVQLVQQVPLRPASYTMLA